MPISRSWSLSSCMLLVKERKYISGSPAENTSDHTHGGHHWPPSLTWRPISAFMENASPSPTEALPAAPEAGKAKTEYCE